MKTRTAEVLSVVVFDSGSFPVLSSSFRCMVQTVLDRVEEYSRRVVVDVVFAGTTESSPSLLANIVAISKGSPGSQIIAIANDLQEAEAALAHGAADCILRSELTAKAAEQRAMFVHSRARYLRQGGDWQLYTHSDLAAIARVLSHDIRNSLSGIVLSLEPIKQVIGNNAEAKSYLEILERSSGKLNTVINRFSTATGNIALKPKMENMVGIVRHAVTTSPEFENHQVNIQENYRVEDIPYSLDRDKFPTAIANLISNAADALEGRPDGVVTVTVDNSPHDAIIIIEDNGHGVDFTTLQNVFRPFFTTRPGKAGLGLPLAHSIIIAHGGHLRLESTIGAGTKVTCTFPLAK